MKKKYFVFLIFIFITIRSNAQNPEKFEHAIWQWFIAADVSDNRLREFAPHFPHPEDYKYNVELYNQAIYRWQRLYCFEYERFINAPELIALNPYYDGYQDIILLPYFLGPLESKEKPIQKSTGSEFEDDLNYELTLQNWYFVFEPQKFKEIYGEINDFPFWFSPEAYRSSITGKIEDNKTIYKENTKN